MSVRTLYLIATILVVIAVALLAPWRGGRETPITASTPPAPIAPLVTTMPASIEAMSRSVRVTGTLQSGSEAVLSAKQGGRIKNVAVTDSQRVRAGQLLVELDASDAMRQYEQAMAGVKAAEANLEKARTGVRLRRVEVEQRVTAAQRGVEQARLQVQKAESGAKIQSGASQADVARAQAGVDAAQSALSQARRGARPEQRRQVEINVQQAERGVEQARKYLEDTEFLHQRGGVPRIQVDQARENHQKALDGLAQARAQLELVTKGASAEEIAAAEAQLRAAQAGLAAAKAASQRDSLSAADIAAAETQLRQAEDGLKAAEASRAELVVAEEDVRAAQAMVEQARAAASLARQQLPGFRITSPIDGVVTNVQAREGEMTGPGRALLTIVSTSGVYLEAAVSSRLLTDIRPGQPAAVEPDATRGKSYPGRVRTVSAVAGADGRSYPVRIDVQAPPDTLQPGGVAHADVVVAEYPDAVTVPSQALRELEAGTVVWVVRDERAVEVAVEVLAQSAERTAVRGGIRSGEPVIVRVAAGVRPGDAVRIH